MSLGRVWVASAVSASLALWGVPAALALTNDPGGATAPGGASAAGGTAPKGPTTHARPASATHPLLSELVLPKSVIPGPPPKVVLEVQESRVTSVEVQVALVSRTAGHGSVTANLGWAPTGRAVTVAWPSSARLTAGAYVLRVSGHDHRGESLLGGAHSPLQLEVDVKAEAAKPAPPPTPPAAGASPPAAGASPPATSTPIPGVPTVEESAAEGAAFPVAGTHNFGGPENAFGAPRSGYSHQGQDILTAEGTPVVAPYAGTIESTSFQEGGAGYYAVEHTTVGFDFFFAHCQANSLAVTAGEAVSAGQTLCRAGETGDATTPHLDFEIWIDGWRTSDGYPINPLPYLEAWEKDGAPA